MSYILGLLAVGVLFLVLHNFTALDYKTKGIVAAVLVATIAFMYLFNVYADKQRDLVMAIERKYKQNSPITCKGVEVNQSTFSYSIGTQTFIGRKGTSHYGELISAATCE